MPARPAAADHTAMRIELLGVPRLVLVAGAAQPLERKDAALLALLALDGPLPRARAAALLWPDADDERARNSLRQRLFRLRRAAGQDVVVAAAALALASGVAHDLAAPAPRLAADGTALAGELLGAFDYEDCLELAEWVAAARERWRIARRDALAEVASRLEADGHIARALPYAERLVADDPLAEHAHRRLMRLHYLRGDRSAALAAFERCRTLLERELRVAPGKETLELAALVDASGALPSAIAPPPIAVLRPPRIVGRDAELQRLADAWEAQQVMVVRGEPGIGKTRLLADFAASHPGARVCAARPGDERVPYASLARLLRELMRSHGRPPTAWVGDELARLLPELGAAPAHKLEPLRLARAANEALAAWRAGGLAAIALDDLHYADEGTLDALPILFGTNGLRWIVGVRANEAPARFADWCARAEPDAYADIELGPLSSAAIGELLATLAIPGLDPQAWIAPLARHTGGNPLFILETLRSLLAAGARALRAADDRLPAPANVGSLIERRLEQLSAPALKLARVAALAGQDFSAELAAEVLGQHALDIADAWRELEAAQVIRDNAFAHDLIFEATLRSVPRAIGQAMHRAIGAYLEAHEAPAVRIAHHWLQAAVWNKAAQQFNAAARANFSASRYVEAGELFRSAADCFERAGDRREQHTALQELAGCQIKSFDLAGARTVAEQLRRIAGDETQVGWALDRLIDTLNMSREDDPAAQAAALDMQRRGHATGQPWMVFNATRKLAVTLAHQGRFDEALSQFASQSDWVERNLHEWNVHVWLCDEAYVLDLADRHAAAIAAYRNAEVLARRFENWGVVYAALRNLALTLAWIGKLDEAVAASDEAVRFSGRLGDALVERNPRDAARRGALLRAAGRLGEALALLRAAHADLARGSSPYWLSYCADQLALLFVQLGQPHRARDLLAGEPPDNPPEAPVSRWIARARVERARGHAPLAWRGRVVDATDEPACPARWRLLSMLERAAELDAPEAIALCDRVAREAQRCGLGGIRLHAFARAAGRAAEAGDGARAAAFARETTVLGAHYAPTGIPVPEALWNVHRGFEAGGAAVPALRALERAVEWIEQSALPNVPDEFVDSFLNRNPVNRAILTTASRRAP